MPLRNLLRSRASVVVVLFVAALIAEFFLLEGTVGISLPTDRHSAISTVKTVEKGTSIHFISHNRRFTVVDLLTNHGTRQEPLVLRETFFMDREDGREGPPNALVTVEALNGEKARWMFQEPGERGEAVTDNLYMVTAFGNGETGNLYTYFSLSNGHKVHTNRYVPLDADALTKLEVAVAP